MCVCVCVRVSWVSVTVIFRWLDFYLINRRHPYWWVAVVSWLNYEILRTRMLQSIFNKSWKQHPTKQHLYDHLSPISKTIQIRRKRHERLYWRSKDELISNVLLWTPSYRRASVGRPPRTYLQQFCTNTWCSLEDLPEVMDDREEWRERVRLRIFLQHVFLTFNVVFRKLRIDLNVPFGFYSGDCFDRNMVRFDSKIRVCECSVRVNRSW